MENQPKMKMMMCLECNQEIGYSQSTDPNFTAHYTKCPQNKNARYRGCSFKSNKL